MIMVMITMIIMIIITLDKLPWIFLTNSNLE